MRNARLIFWLFLATLAAGAANFLLSLQKPIVQELPNRTLVDPSLVITSLTISRPGQPSIILSKSDRWRLTAPYVGNVDEQVVLRLLDAFAFATIEDVLPEKELNKIGRTREDFGLLEPCLTVTLASDDEAMEISFGALTPAETGIYASRGGSGTILAVPKNVFAAVDLTADAFRDRAAFLHYPDAINGFDLKRPGEQKISFTLEDGVWKVGSSVASVAKTQELLSYILDARAKKFIWPIGATNETDVVSAAVLSGYGLDSESALTLNIRCRDGINRVILLGHDVGDSETYALIHGGAAVVTLDSNLKIAATQSAQAFMDKRLLPVEEATVRAFSITDGDMSYVLARTDKGTWRLDSPLSAPADSDAVSALLGRILALTPTDQTANGVRVSVSTNLPTVSVYAKSVISGRLEDLRSREILKLDPALVKRIVSTPNESTGREQVSVGYQRERRVWNEETKGSIARPVAEQNIAAILSELASLQAERIVALKASAMELASYGLEEPAYTISIDQDRIDSVRRNILLGNETDGGRFATVGSAEAIFVLSSKTVSVLTAALVEE